MRKSERVQQARLDAMELEFRTLLSKCLVECAAGRWGLFGQNALADPEDRYWAWPEAKHLRELAADIRLERSRAGQINEPVERFLALCGAGDSNAKGEPKLALYLLGEMREESRNVRGMDRGEA